MPFYKSADTLSWFCGYPRRCRGKSADFRCGQSADFVKFLVTSTAVQGLSLCTQFWSVLDWVLSLRGSCKSADRAEQDYYYPCLWDPCGDHSARDEQLSRVASVSLTSTLFAGVTQEDGRVNSCHFNLCTVAWLDEDDKTASGRSYVLVPAVTHLTLLEATSAYFAF